MKSWWIYLFRKIVVSWGVRKEDESIDVGETLQSDMRKSIESEEISL
jgi:hypothetical protein